MLVLRFCHRNLWITIVFVSAIDILRSVIRLILRLIIIEKTVARIVCPAYMCSSLAYTACLLYFELTVICGEVDC